MKKMTTEKNPREPQKKFKCPQCGKSFQNAQGLSGHVRYLHPKLRRRSRIARPAAKQKARVGAPGLVPSTGAREHLQAAFAALSQRVRETEAEVSRLEALKAEKEIIRREFEAVQVALQVFEERESVADENGVAKRVKGNPALDTEEATGAKEDSRQGQSRGANAHERLEFTGNKTEFARAIVQSRGSAGAAAKDVDQVFVERGIEKSKNAIYNALDSLVRQKKLKKKDGHYFYMESAVG